MDMIRDDLAALAIRHDVFFSERSLAGGEDDAVAATIADLRARDLDLRGPPAPPQGAPDEDWEDREQTLFRATQFGDDVDRPLLKSDGSYTYFAADIAYHRSKFERGYPAMIDVWGADQWWLRQAHAGGGEGDQPGARVRSDVKLCQLVRLFCVMASR